MGQVLVLELMFPVLYEPEIINVKRLTDILHNWIRVEQSYFYKFKSFVIQF